MICPNCRSDEFCIEKVLDLGGDAWSDEIRFQLLRCRHCGLTAAGAYQESRRGSTDSDCFEHYAYCIGLAEWAELERTVSMCPDPELEDCRCCAHRLIGQRSSNDRWTLATVLKEPGDRFSIDR